MAECFAVAAIAREVGSDNPLTANVGVVFHKVFKDKKKADEFAIELSKKLANQVEQTVMTPTGAIKMFCGEVGVHPVEFEE